jgi:hypothetical protein
VYGDASQNVILAISHFVVFFILIVAFGLALVFCAVTSFVKQQIRISPKSLKSAIEFFHIFSFFSYRERYHWRRADV